MIETETSKKISNEELLQDIELTVRELGAYQKLSSGFLTLMKLPENISSGKSTFLAFEANKYMTLESECTDFLKKLHALKAERGLQ